MDKLERTIVVHMPCPQCGDCNHFVFSRQKPSEFSLENAMHVDIEDCQGFILAALDATFPVACQHCQTPVQLELVTTAVISVDGEKKKADVLELASHVTSHKPH